MTITSKQITKIIFLAVGFVIAISATYVWVLPRFFDGYRSYSILILGVVMAGAWSGYLGFHSRTAGRKIIQGSLCGLTVAVVVAVLSLLIIVNMRGT
jgi:hypothetical protein